MKKLFLLFFALSFNILATNEITGIVNKYAIYYVRLRKRQAEQVGASPYVKIKPKKKGQGEQGKFKKRGKLTPRQSAILSTEWEERKKEVMEQEAPKILVWLSRGGRIFPVRLKNYIKGMGIKAASNQKAIAEY